MQGTGALQMKIKDKKCNSRFFSEWQITGAVVWNNEIFFPYLTYKGIKYTCGWASKIKSSKNPQCKYYNNNNLLPIKAIL